MRKVFHVTNALVKLIKTDANTVMKSVTRNKQVNLLAGLVDLLTPPLDGLITGLL